MNYFYLYNPNVCGNAVLLTAFALLALTAIYYGVQTRTYLYSLVLIIGLSFEVMGFASRIVLHSHTENRACFFLSLFGTVLGSSFICVNSFMVLLHILGIYNATIYPFRPLVTGVVISVFAIITVLLELTGIALVAFEPSSTRRDQGRAIVATGLAAQILSLIACTGLHLELTISLKPLRETLNLRHSHIYSSPRVKQFLIGINIASILMITYSIYGLVEFVRGSPGAIFNDETAFMVIGGALPFLASVLLTIFRPGATFSATWTKNLPLGLQRPGRPEAVQVLVPSGHPVHPLYEPDIRKKAFSKSPGHPSSSIQPPELPKGSIGLPANPAPVSKRSTLGNGGSSICGQGFAVFMSPTPTQTSQRIVSKKQKGISQRYMVPDEELW